MPHAHWNRDDLWDLAGPPSPDLAVVLGERELRRDPSPQTQTAVAARWVDVLGQGLPLMSECFGLAAARLRRWQRSADELPTSLRDDVAALQALFDDALVDVRTDGLLVTYLGYEVAGAPALRKLQRAFGVGV